MLGNLTFFPHSPRARFLSLFRAERNRQTRNDRSHKLKERRTERASPEREREREREERKQEERNQLNKRCLAAEETTTTTPPLYAR